MACNIEQIKKDGVQKVKDMIKGNAKNISFTGDAAVFSLKGKKIRTVEQALAVAKKKQEAIEKWSEETFGDKAYGNWTNVLERNGTVVMEVNFPKTLEKAYEQKIANQKSIADIYAARTLSNEYVLDGEVYPSLEDMQAAMELRSDYFPVADPYNSTNFNDYLSAKKNLLSKVRTRLDTLLAKRKYEKGNIKADIQKVRKIVDRLEAEVHELQTADNIFEMTMSVFNKDLDLIRDLISGDRPHIEDIHTAEYMLSYFDIISDYSADNKLNDFVNTSDPRRIEPDVREVLDKLRSTITEYKSDIYTAKKNYLLELIESSPKLKSIFPAQQEEEIRDLLLKDEDDIGIVSQFFGTVDKQFTKQDSLLGQLIRLELEKSRSINKSYAAKQIQKMNDLVPTVKRKLLDMGYGISWSPLNSLFSEVSYDLFYQTTENGKRTGKLVSPYSDKWYKAQGAFIRKNSTEYRTSIMERNWEGVNSALVQKYNWINENADFLDITRLQDISSLDRFKEFFDTPVNDDSYKQSIISTIGKQNYDRLIQEQIEKLDDYLEYSRHEVETLLASHGVDTVQELPDNVFHSLNITLSRNNPIKFLDSHKSGQKGRIDYVIGQTGNQYQSHLKYNSYFPKSRAMRVDFNTGMAKEIDTGYFDASFDRIKQDPDLLEFWENLNDSVTFMNMTLSDASKRLTHNSLPHMEKFTSDVLLDKDNSLANKFSTLLTSTKETIGNMLSTRISDIKANDIEDINKSSIQHIQDRVGLRVKTRILEFKKDNGRAPNKQEVAVIREEVTHEVSMEQAFNLPVVIRAYLDMVAEYKSQRDSLPKISVFKNLYENIRLEKKNSFDPISKIANSIRARGRENGIQDKRLRANKRMDHWFNKNVMNLEDKEYWVKFGKFHTKDEKKFLEAAKEELKSLEAQALLPQSAKMADRIATEIFELNDTIDNIGKNYTLAAMYNTVFNKFRIFVGLAYNLASNITNRFQGWYSGAINDTGKFWTAGNFYVTNAFINRKGLRHIPGNGKYKNEMKKTRLFIDKLNIIQDATNEIDRARNDSGFTGTVKKLNPFYITEYTEWHNQTPQILAMLMDHKITDKNGNTVSIFDGTTFPAHRIDENGEIVLKPDFATENNIDTWQNFSNKESATIKSGIGDTISILNGDYSKTGSTYVKSSNIGKTVMTFKTWLPNQLWQRFAYDQKSLALGKERFDGTYTGAYTSSKTGTAATALLATGLLTTGVMGLGLGLGTVLAAGAIVGNIHMNRKAIAGGEELLIAEQLADAGLAIIKKMIGLPVNTLSGKNIIKAHEFNRLNVTEAERQNLKSIVNEISILLGLTLAKVIIKAAYAGNEEEEPKTIDGKTANPYYGTNERTELEKQYYNFMENQLTKTISDISIYANPDALYTSMSTTSMATWLTRIKALSGAVDKALLGLDELSTGPNAGESRLLNELKKTFLPSIGQGSLGFETMLEKEFNPNENMDSWFYSDYKSDRKKSKVNRAVAREKLNTYWKKEFDYDGQDILTQKQLDAVIKKLVNQEIKATNGYPPRYLYDDEQQLIGSD